MKPTILTEKHEELMRKDPVYAKIASEIEEPPVADSLIKDEFIPDHHSYYLEIDRINKNITRYPYGFRHYENYENYQLKFPNATIQEYMDDGK